MLIHFISTHQGASVLGPVTEPLSFLFVLFFTKNIYVCSIHQRNALNSWPIFWCCAHLRCSFLNLACGVSLVWTRNQWLAGWAGYWRLPCSGPGERAQPTLHQHHIICYHFLLRSTSMAFSLSVNFRRGWLEKTATRLQNIFGHCCF